MGGWDNMRIPTVEKFLFCLELKTGSLIIGILNLIAAIILGLVSLFFLGTTIFATVAVNTVDWSSAFANVTSNSGNTYPGVGDRFDSGSDGGGSAKTGVNMAMGFAIAMSAILCIICLGYLIVASMLIHGTRKETTAGRAGSRPGPQGLNCNLNW